MNEKSYCQYKGMDCAACLLVDTGKQRCHKPSMLISVLNILDLVTQIGNNFDSSYKFIGIRIIDTWYDEYNTKIGDTLRFSHKWDSNNPTDQTLDGTSAINIKANLKQSFFSYPGNKCLVIGGDCASAGEDDGEIVIRNARVLDVKKITVQK